jgi:hypothetical protein
VHVWENGRENNALLRIQTCDCFFAHLGVYVIHYIAAIFLFMICKWKKGYDKGDDEKCVTRMVFKGQ